MPDVVINENSIHTDECTQINPIPQGSSVLTCDVDIIVTLFYRILDGKHDFGGGGTNDRSYINNTDCNNTIFLEQLKSYLKLQKSLNESDLTDLKFKKYLVDGSGVHTPPLCEKDAICNANTVHDVFDFTTGFEKYPFVQNQSIKITLEKGDQLLASYCIKRPFYGEYQLMTKTLVKKSSINQFELDRLRADVNMYGEHAIYCMKVGKKDGENGFKTNDVLMGTLNEIFNFKDASHTIDATHISNEIKDKLLPKKSQCIFGDVIDPSTAKNEINIRNVNNFKNRFHYCFIQNTKIDIELKLLEDKRIGITFYNPESESESKQIILHKDAIAPSVSDISLYIYTNLLQGDNVSNLLALFGKVKDYILKKPNKVQPIIYFDTLFEVIIDAIKTVLPNSSLTTEEIIVILTSLKTVGDQTRLIDTQNLTQINEGIEAYCLTLDKFLFDYGVASSKVYLLGDSPSTSNFELIVYQRLSEASTQTRKDNFMLFYDNAIKKANRFGYNEVPSVKLNFAHLNEELQKENMKTIDIQKVHNNKFEIEKWIKEKEEEHEKQEGLIKIESKLKENKEQDYYGKILTLNTIIKHNIPQSSSLSRRRTLNIKDIQITDATGEKKSQIQIISEYKDFLSKLYYGSLLELLQALNTTDQDSINSNILYSAIKIGEESDVDGEESDADLVFKNIKKIVNDIKNKNEVFVKFKKHINSSNNFFLTAHDTLYRSGFTYQEIYTNKDEILTLPGSIMTGGGSPKGDDIIAMLYRIIDIDMTQIHDSNINKQNEKIKDYFKKIETDIVSFMDLCHGFIEENGYSEMKNILWWIDDCQETRPLISNLIKLLIQYIKQINNDIDINYTELQFKYGNYVCTSELIFKENRGAHANIENNPNNNRDNPVVKIVEKIVEKMEQNDDGQTDNESMDTNYDSDTGSIFDPIREEETDDVVMKVTLEGKSQRQNKFKKGVDVKASRNERNRKTTQKQQEQREKNFAKIRGTGGSKTKKNRPKKYKKHSTRSKKVSKNKTRKRHSTRSKRQKKKKSQ